MYIKNIKKEIVQRKIEQTGIAADQHRRKFVFEIAMVT